MDPIHSRIATDFAIDKRRYSFRWGGDADPTGEQGCTLKEATIALACAIPDPWFAVQAKREISVLWDTESPRYKQLFPPEIAATKIWNAVRILRAVDGVVNVREFDTAPRADMVASHLQRLVLHIVFQDPDLEGWETETAIAPRIPTVESVANRVFERVRQYVTTHHQSEYLASLSKNFDKCSQLAARILKSDLNPAGGNDGWLPGFDNT